jgi:hypothetical protein
MLPTEVSHSESIRRRMPPHIGHFLVPRSLRSGDIHGQLLPMTNLALSLRPRVRDQRSAKVLRGVLVVPKRRMH